MKCLLIASIFSPINGGSAVVYENICRNCPEGSIQVLAPWRHYCTGEVIDGWQAFDETANYAIHRIELLRPEMVTSKSLLHSLWLLLSTDIPLKLVVLWKTIRLVRKEKIDVVCIGELNSGSWFGLFCQRWLGCKMVNYIHGEEITTDTTSRLYRRNRKKYLRLADAIVAASQFTRQALIEQMEVESYKIEVIENGVDIDRFFPAPKDQALFERYHLRGKRVVLSVGRLIERKGVDMTLRAMPKILEKCPNTHHLIVGEGEYRNQLRHIVQTLRLESHVTFTGAIPAEELAKHYQLCDVFVMPNRELSNHDTEGFGLVFLEANASRKAVVAGRAGGTVEAVRDGENGLLVDGTQVNEIAQAVIRLLTNQSLRQKMEQRGLAIARASSAAERAHQFYALCQRLSEAPDSL